MVNQTKLSAVLGEFARTLITDFPIQGILDQLVRRIVEVLPVTAAGVTLIAADGAVSHLTASNDIALAVQHLQSDLAEGPCLAAFATGDSIEVSDLASDARFPRFGPQAVEAGMAAVFTFPLRHGVERIGALDLYRDTAGALDPGERAVAQTLADVAAAYVLNATARADAQVQSDHYHHRALHDDLTGLPNRVLLHERIEHAGQRAARAHTNVAVLFVDLDHFKVVNDTHGHRVGDQLLLAVVRRLQHLVRAGDTLARLGGDEFVFLCEDLQGAGDVTALVRRIEEVFSCPFALPERDLHLAITASVGIVVAGQATDIGDALIAKADLAMYAVKRRGGAGHRIVDVHGAPALGDGSLEGDFRRALADGDLAVVYQPIVRVPDGSMVGVEALLRWNHPVHGTVPTEAIVAMAELSGQIADVGHWLLDRACRDHHRWRHEHPDAARRLDLAVNVSGHQLMRPDFCDDVLGTLAGTGTDPHDLVLELTESVLIDDSDATIAVLDRLVEHGVRLALDDFGVGYSSLSYLRRLPVHAVKIDRRFVADIGVVSPNGRAIVTAVTNLAHVLGLTVIAEGVETAGQHAEIVAMGCELAQGYFYDRPMLADALSSRIGRRSARADEQTAPDPALSRGTA